MKNSPLEGPPLDRKQFFAFSRSSWYKSLPRSSSPDERCTWVLMAQFQSPLCGSIPGVICVLIPSIGMSPVYVQQVGYGATDPRIWSHWVCVTVEPAQLKASLLRCRPWCGSLSSFSYT
ncbi:hypothetical protein TNCV_4265601 [Trichonephila clavipes]|nr:hypothetical protein TNCV_4265601 [Trichonephila clavipes]